MKKLATCTTVLIALVLHFQVRSQNTLVPAVSSSGQNKASASGGSTFLTGSVGISMAGSSTSGDKLLKSGYIGVISQFLLVNDAPFISYTPPNSITSTSTVLVDIEDQLDNITSAILYARPIGSNDNFSPFNLTLKTDNTYQYEIQAGSEPFNAMGMEFYFEAEDQASKLRREPSTGSNFLYTGVQNLEFPTPTPYSSANDYRIISVPYEIGSNQVSTLFEDIFDETTGYDNTQWRLFGYEGGDDFIEYPNGNTATFERGKAYWFGIRAGALETIGLNKDAESIAPKNNPEALFQLTLSPGWNMVGNPYTIPINWSDILTYNGNSNMGELFVFDGEYNAATELGPFEGGVVFVEGTENVTLDISFPGQTNPSVRVNEPLIFEKGWSVQFTLSQGSKNNKLSMIGMHTNASETKDIYDSHNPPRFQTYLELNSLHPEHPEGSFSKDIVSLASNYVWKMKVESDTDEEITLSWASEDFAQIESLYLLDKTKNRLIDMKLSQSALVDSNSELEILYGRQALDELEIEIVEILPLYPNPSRITDQVTIPWISNAEGTSVSVAFFDTDGTVISNFHQVVGEPGTYRITWDLTSERGKKVAPGMYFYRVEISTTSDQQWTASGKILVNH